MDTTPQDMEQVRRGLRSGGPEVLETLWDLFADDLFTLLLGMLGSRHDAEDALQDLFAAIARKRWQVAEARDMRSYLIRMTRNTALNAVRRRGRTEVRDPQDGRWLDVVSPVDGTPAAGDARALEAALAALPEEQRTVIALKAWRGLTFEEIGRAVGVSIHTAASRYRYGLDRLRTLMGSKEEWL